MDNNFFQLTTDVRQLITSEQAWHYRIVPVEVSSNSISFYTDEPKNDNLEDLELLFDKDIHLLTADRSKIQLTLARYYQKSEQNFSTELNGSEDFLDKIISEAKYLNSSDIHIEKYQNRNRVRIRIDGKLQERYTIKDDVYPSIVNKIKIRSNLDIAEKRLPQDGRIRASINNQNFDIRVSIIPAMHGEKIVLRLLSQDAGNIEIEKLGFLSEQLGFYRKAINKPQGIILISGPTGSGKTTTLYATLKELNKTTSNIMTVEDPIEYTLEGINQVQMNESIGMTFARALRSFLRQDPDIIMLGEIRDEETANMAIRAALTGHLVLSTIHTNSAIGIISRLIDMGVPSYLIANTLNVAVAQRLIRLLCPNCKTEKQTNNEDWTQYFNNEIETHYSATGCEECYYTGYKGRKAIYEVIPVTTELINAIKLNEHEKHAQEKEQQTFSLSKAAKELFINGQTSIEEIYPLLLSN